MPTLKLIASPKREDTGRRSGTASDAKPPAAEGCDDRFSQPPNESELQAKGDRNDAFSIASAMSLHENHPSLRRIRGSIGGGAADVVGVVLSAPSRQPPNITAQSRMPKTSHSSRISMLVGDHTLPQGQCARVSMTVSSSTAATVASLLGVTSDRNASAHRYHTEEEPQGAGRMGQLQPGDVVRWNRLEVRNSYDVNVATGEKRKRPGDVDDAYQSLLSVACDMSPSWADPAAGPSLARLCRIVSAADGGHSLKWENGIHPSMETPKEVVWGLAGWYCQRAMPSSAAILSTNRFCQRRKLRDITAPIVLSHVVVKALRCEKKVVPFATPRKKADVVLTHVTLSDGPGSDDLMGLGCSGHAFSSLPASVSEVMLQSMKEGSRVLLTHVLSQAANPSSMQGQESLVLVPTRETTATLLTPDHPYYVHSPSRQNENQFASQPLTVERASQLYSMTQQNSPPAINDDSNRMSRCRGVMAVVAPLKDIIVDGFDTSFVEGSYWQSPQRLSRFLIDNTSISTGFSAIKVNTAYRSATLILDPKCVSSEIVVNADADALKLLCMDVPSQDMVVGDTAASNPYLCHVGELLKGLCNERVPIRWILEQESECNWFVTAATLLEI